MLQPARIDVRTGRADVVVLAPHGGDIEPGSSEIAAAIAGDDLTYYAFVGLLEEGNRRLRVPSTAFDEPRAVALVTTARRAVAVHGAAGAEAIAWIGGRDGAGRDAVVDRLRAAGFDARTASGALAGVDPSNIVNRTATGSGIQLELTWGLRAQLFDGDVHARHEVGVTWTLQRFADAVRAVVR